MFSILARRRINRLLSFLASQIKGRIIPICGSTIVEFCIDITGVGYMQGESYSNDVAICAIRSKNCSHTGRTLVNNVKYTRAENR